MKTVLKYLNPFYGRMIVSLIIKVTGSLAELTLPYILSHILKNVILLQDVEQIVKWGILMIIFSTIACVSNIVANRMVAKVSRDFSKNIRHDLFAKMLQLTSSQTDRFTIASLESRITTDTYHIHHFIGMMRQEVLFL